MMEKKLDTFEELMLDFLAGKLSEDGERKLLHFLQSDISYQQRYKEMARTRAKSFIGKFEQEKQADYEALSVKLGLKKKSGKEKDTVVAYFLASGCYCFIDSYYFYCRLLYI